MARPEMLRAPPPAILLALVLTALTASQGASAQAAAEPIEPARAAIRLKSYREAIEKLQPIAQRGDAAAQYLLASLYRAGLGTAVDTVKARELLLTAAQNRHAGAAYSLAVLLANDEPRDTAQARVWLERAAQAGHPLAQAAAQRGALPLQFLPQKDLTEADARRAALWLAAQQDDAQLVSVLIDADMLKRTDEFGRGVLALAAQGGAAHVVALLLERGASPKQADSFGITPLMLAARSANDAVVAALLGAGAPLDAVDRVGNSALMYAAAAGGTQIVRRLLDAGAAFSLLNAQRWSALDGAVEAESTAAADLLRQRGLSTRRVPQRVAGVPAVPLLRANDAAGDLYRNIPDLQVAASRSSPALVKAVIQQQRAANRTTPMPDGAVFFAAISGSPATLDALFAAGASTASGQRGDPLPWLLMRGKPDALTTVLAQRKDLADAKNGPLLLAVTAQRIEAVRALLDAHANTEVRDVGGRTPLMLAAASAQADAVRALLSNVARTDAVDKLGRTALWYASAAGAADIVASLLAQKSEVDVADTAGVTPLAIASARGHAAVVTSLLGAGAKVRAATRNASTPLMLAAQAGHSGIIAQLLAAGAIVDGQNRYGDTALIVAVRAGQVATVRQLLSAGASDKLRNGDRVSALDVANALGLQEIAALLQRA